MNATQPPATFEMKGRPVDQLVFEHMFPKPRQSDPQNFHALLQRHLILEVRQEVHSFYGHSETQEAKYPGLDYNHHTHRLRLSRWQWHRRLFRALDALRLTPNEIASLTKWEGTKWAKERYEREHGVTIRDTTADEFSDWIEPENRPPRQTQANSSDHLEAVQDATTDENTGEDSDEELESVGVDLNVRLRERIALRNDSGDTTMPLDEEWEQWLKQAIEAGEPTRVADQIALWGPQASPVAEDIFPSRMVAAARNGDWHEIPDFLHEMMRQSLNGERQPSTSSSSRSPAATTPSTSTTPRSATATVAPSGLRSRLLLSHDSLNSLEQRRTYSDLRLPATDAVRATPTDFRVHRTAQSGA